MLRKFWILFVLLSILTASVTMADPIITHYKFKGVSIAEMQGTGFDSGVLLAQSSGVVTGNEAIPFSVILGEAPVYANCELRYQLKTTEWSSLKIMLEFHEPEILDGKPLYIFVVDEDGIPSSGFHLDLNPSPPGRPESVGPGVPGQPVMIGN